MAKIVSLTAQPVIHAEMSPEEQIAELRRLIDEATGPTGYVVTITPTMAKAIVATDAHKMQNRQLRSGKIAQYAEAMKDRSWVLTGQPLVFEGGALLDALGRLLDGYHRVAACIRANRPFVTFIVVGIEAKAFRMLDTGIVRTMGDAFKIDEVPDPKHMPYAVRWIKILTGRDPFARQIKLTNDEALNFYRSLDTVRLHQLLPDAKAINKRSKKLLTTAQVLAFLYLAKPTVARRAAVLLTAKSGHYVAVHDFMEAFRETHPRIDENVRTVVLQTTFDAIRRNERLTQRQLKDALLAYRANNEARPR
jgi:hypothetical protein